MREEVLACLAIRSNKINPPGKKSFQKLVYFLQEQGVPLGYRYTMYFYGPYSKKLADEMDSLVYEGLLKYEPAGDTVHVKPGKVADLVVEDGETVLREFDRPLQFVLDRLARKSAKELELLATVHYVGKQDSVRETVIHKAHELKKDKFNAEEVCSALDELKDLQLLSW